MHSRQNSLTAPELKREAPSQWWDSLDTEGHEEPPGFATCPGPWFSGHMGLAVHIHFRVMQAML